MFMLYIFNFLLLLNYGIFHCYGRRISNSYFRKLNPPPVILPKPDGKCAPQLHDCSKDTIYYSYDGSCNNLNYSNLGQAVHPFERILPANFSDGDDQQRVSVDGSPLPNARTIRTTVLPIGEYRDIQHNILFYAFGQFNNHDASEHRPLDVDKPCCENGKPINPMPYECLPTIMPENDAFYSQFGVTCVDTQRSTTTKYRNCTQRPIDQFNFQTAFLDLSILYGPNKERAYEIRHLKHGLLKSAVNSTTSFQEYPFLQSGSNKCPFEDVRITKMDTCFYSGDNRINQNPEIFLFETVFHRLHNYLAESLHKINRKWNDEELYQRARRIGIAMYQHVFGAEFVPAIIGSDAASIYELFPATNGYVSGYNPKINPQTFHEYAASVGRSGHSYPRGTVMFDKSGSRISSYKLREIFYAMDFFLKKDAFLHMIEAYAFQKCNKEDKNISEELSNYLFPLPDLSYGNDLSALDINRGREYGLESYNHYRVACGLSKLRRFEDLADEITNPEDIYKLKSLYHHVDDIDLYVGGLLELPYKDSTLGPTFTCILGAQFAQWKFGDRKFYEFPTAKFTSAQLQTIRSTTLAQILCITVPQLELVPKNAFYTVTKWNPNVYCNNIRRIDLTKWIEY